MPLPFDIGMQNSVVRRRIIQGQLIEGVEPIGNRFSSISLRLEDINEPVIKPAVLRATRKLRNKQRFLDALNTNIDREMLELELREGIIRSSTSNVSQATEETSTAKDTWLTKKKHFRDTEEWKKKKARIMSKLRALSKLNLALVLSRMPMETETSYGVSRGNELSFALRSLPEGCPKDPIRII